MVVGWVRGGSEGGEGRTGRGRGKQQMGGRIRNEESRQITVGGEVKQSFPTQSF